MSKKTRAAIQAGQRVHDGAPPTNDTHGHGWRIIHQHCAALGIRVEIISHTYATAARARRDSGTMVTLHFAPNSFDPLPDTLRATFGKYSPVSRELWHSSTIEYLRICTPNGRLQAIDALSAFVEQIIQYETNAVRVHGLIPYYLRRTISEWEQRCDQVLVLLADLCRDLPEPQAAAATVRAATLRDTVNRHRQVVVIAPPQKTPTPPHSPTKKYVDSLKSAVGNMWANKPQVSRFRRHIGTSARRHKKITAPQTPS